MATTTASKRVKLPAQLQQVEDLLLWTNPLKSAAFLGGATLLYLLLEWSGVPLLTWLSNAGLIAVAATALWAAGARVFNTTGPSEHLPPLLRTGVDEEVIKGLAERGRVLTNKGLAKLGVLLSGEDLVLSAKAFGLLWLVGWVGRFITPVGLLYTVVVALFALPKLYEMRKDEIDDAVGKSKVLIEAQVGNIKTKGAQLIQRLTPQKGPRPASKTD